MSQSPSPYNYSQLEQQSQSRTRSFKDQTRNSAQNQLDFAQMSTMNQVNKNAANSMGSVQDQSIATQSLPGVHSQPAMGSADSRFPNQHNAEVLEDDFFDQHASLLMQ